MYPGERTGGYAYDSTSVLAGTPAWGGAGEFRYQTPYSFEQLQGQSDLHYRYDERTLGPATLTLQAGDSIWLLDQGPQLLGHLPDAATAVSRTLWVAEYEGDGVVQFADGEFDFIAPPTFTDRPAVGVVGTSHFFETRPLNVDALNAGNLAFRITCTSGTVVLTFAGLQIEGAAGYLVLASWTWSGAVGGGLEESDMLTYDGMIVQAQGGGAGVHPSFGQSGLGQYGYWDYSHDPGDVYDPSPAAALARGRTQYDAGQGTDGLHATQTAWEVTHVGTSQDVWSAFIYSYIELAAAPQRGATTTPAMTELSLMGLSSGSDYLDWEWVDTNFTIQDWRILRTIQIGTSDVTDPIPGNVEVRLLGTSFPTPPYAGGSGSLLATIYTDGGYQETAVDLTLGTSSPTIAIVMEDMRYRTASLATGPVPEGNGGFAKLPDGPSYGIIGIFRRPMIRYKVPTFMPGPSPQSTEGPAGFLLFPNPLLGGAFDQVDVNFG